MYAYSMKKQTAYDAQTDETITQYSLIAMIPGGKTYGDLRQFAIRFKDGTPRSEIARRLWHELRPARRGMTPIKPERIRPA